MRKKTDIRLDMAMNYHSKYEIEIDTKALNPRKNKLARLTFRDRLIGNRVVSLILGVVFLLTGTLSMAAPAHALPSIGDPQNACASWIMWNGEPVGRNVLDPKLPEGNVKLTGLEKFGTFSARPTFWWGPWEPKDNPKGLEGTNYSSENDFYGQGNNNNCFRQAELTNWVFTDGIYDANAFGVAVMNKMLDISLTAAEGDGILSGFSNSVEEIITGEDANGDGVASGNGMRDTLYMNFLIPVIMIGSLVVLTSAWKRRYTEGFSHIGWIAVSVTTGILIMATPMWIPKTSNTVVSSVTSGIVASIGEAAMSSSGEEVKNLCTVGPEATGAKATSRELQCMLWYAFVYQPWKKAQFGTSGQENTRAGEIPYSVDMGGGQTLEPRNWATFQLDQQWKNESMSQADIDKKNENQMLLAQIFVGDPGEGRGGMINTSWTGADNNRGTIAYMTLMALLVAAFVLIPLAVALIAFSAILIFLVLAATFLLLPAAIPGFGKSIAMKAMSTLANVILKQILYSMFLGIAIFAYIVALQALDFIVGFFLVIALTVAIQWFKSMVLNIVSVNIGGQGDFNLPDPVEKMDNAAARARATATGALVGGGVAVVSRLRGVKGGSTNMNTTTSSAPSTSRGNVPKQLEAPLVHASHAGPETSGSMGSSNGTSSSGTKAPRRVGLDTPQGDAGSTFSPASPATSAPVAGGSVPVASSEAPVVGVIPAITGSNGVKSSTRASISPNIEKPSKGTAKHVATSDAVAVKAPSFTKSTPEAPKAKSVMSVATAGAFKGAVKGFQAQSVGSAATAGLEAGKEVSTNVSAAEEAKAREIAREIKAAEKAEHLSVQSRRETRKTERVAQGLPVKTPVKKPAPQGLPGSTPKTPVGLPPRRSSHSSGGTSRAGSR